MEKTLRKEYENSFSSRTVVPQTPNVSQSDDLNETSTRDGESGHSQSSALRRENAITFSSSTANSESSIEQFYDQAGDKNQSRNDIQSNANVSFKPATGEVTCTCNFSWLRWRNRHA